MAGIFQGTPQTLSDLIANGINQSLAEELEKKIHENIDPMIKSLALDYAGRITTNVQSYKSYKHDKVELTVIFNKEELTRGTV